jgi:hypothetical protein
VVLLEFFGHIQIIVSKIINLARRYEGKKPYGNTIALDNVAK